MIGKVFKAPQRVIESGFFIVVGKDSDPVYNPVRKPWYLQVREYLNGEAVGPWIPITLREFKEWNPDATPQGESWLARGNKGGTAEFC